MSSHINPELRRLVAARAFDRCEYCLIHREDAFAGCEFDHVISVKHGGETVSDNLALSCAYCNRFKGTDIGSIVPATGQFVRFFNPRSDTWHEHFALNGSTIEALTAIGAATAMIFRFNEPERTKERSVLQASGRYPRKIARS
jgi:hypothetical protein